MKCQECTRDFAAELFRELTGGTVVSGGVEQPAWARWMCPVCANEMVNRQHRLPSGTPFRGPIAEAMRQKALEHLKATGQTGRGAT